MKLLCLGPQNVIPAVDGGKESIHGALSALAKQADVTYVFPGVTDAQAREKYQHIGVKAVAILHTPRDTITGVLLSTLALYPFKFAKYSSYKFVRQVDAALDSHAEFDAIVCFHTHTFRLAERLRRRRGWTIPIVLREHNLEYELVASYVTAMPRYARIPGKFLTFLTRKAEERAWRSATAVAFITDADLRVANYSGVRGNFFHAPEGTPALPVLPPIPVCTQNLIILLNPKATQSVYNVKQFLKETWFQNCDHAALSSVNLLITGVNLEQAANVLGFSAEKLQASRVKPVGFVPSLTDVLCSSLAMVSPSYVGGGIRKKILEAMAHGVPVIASLLDVHSCSYFVDSKNILAFESNAQFVRSVDILRSDPTMRASIVEHGFRVIEDHANWAHFATVFMSKLREVLPSAHGLSIDDFEVAYPPSETFG